MNLLKFSREFRSFDTELKWAAIFVLGMVSWAFAERMMGLHREHLHALADSRHVVMIFFAICYLACLNEKRKKYQGERMRYWDGLVCCVTMTILILVALVPANYFVLNVISPDLLFNLTQYEIANTHFAYHEVLERNTMASYNLEHFTRFILYGLGLSLMLPLFLANPLARLDTLFSGNLS